MQTLQVPIYAAFLPAIDENQFAQAAKWKRNKKQERQKKIKARQAGHKQQQIGRMRHWKEGTEDTGKLSLKPGCRHSCYYFNSKQTYFNFNARLWRGDSNKRKKGHKASERNAQSNQSPRNEMQNQTKDQKQKQLQQQQ